MARLGTFLAQSVAGLATLFLSLAHGQVTFRNFYDGNGQLFRVLDSSGNLVEYDYDLAGNPTQIRRSVVAPGALSILNIVPQRGSSGASVTIYGQNFSSVAAGDTVMFNGVAATVLSASATALVVQVPIGVTTGPVSITVNGTTVTSGNLDFTVPAVPTITSITPAAGYIGENLTMTVQGTNLTNAIFEFQGTGLITITNTVVASSTEATFTATVGQDAGIFVLFPFGSAGAGSAVPTAANTFRVYEPPGDNYAVVQLSVFNTYIPQGTDPGVPAGFNAASQQFSTFNTYVASGTEPDVPPGSNAASQLFSTFNTYIAPGTQPDVPSGSNTSFQLFSTNNSNADAQQVVPRISILPLLSDGKAAATAAGAGAASASNPGTFWAGQTVQITIDSPAGFLPNLHFRVNGVALGSSNSGTLNTLFTVPHGLAALTLQATGQTASGLETDSPPQQIVVTPDPGRTLAGRVVDARGQPAPGAAITWQANGLAAEYYQFNQELSGIPDLTGLQASRTSYVSALNNPNPQQVFGKDPLGVGLGQNAAVRFHGKLFAEAGGIYQLLLRASSGARLSIDGQTLAETAPSSADFSDAVATTGLLAGLHDLEVIYYDSGAAETMQLFWTPPGGVQGIVPPAALTVSAPAATAGAGGRFLVSVPAALDGIQVTAANGLVILDQ